MGKCISHQEVLKRTIVREKWIEEVAHLLTDAFLKFEDNEVLSVERALLQKAMTTSGRGRALAEAIQRARQRLKNPPSFESFLQGPLADVLDRGDL